ncbi:hypothetical protein RB614_35350 [Phytohabitans sp. ZYX-F-186]|uniref:Uncharacterized protein n=2 Tax=Phytohabitans maris TaxID=3071409 RepID=A0ABU0ZS49_9ACTN|nr:hypothetical protein [Phytohabitans sp. ZYX-F-186]
MLDERPQCLPVTAASGLGDLDIGDLIGMVTSTPVTMVVLRQQTLLDEGVQCEFRPAAMVRSAM